MSLTGGFWREAATVILAAKCKPTANFNYKILMLKRSQRSKFLPETQVFPGGVISDADFDPRWHDLFKSVTGQSLFNPGPRFMDRGYLTEMFRVDRPKNLLPAQIAFRLCAIRETFEESGVLLVTNDPKSGETLGKAETKYTLDLTDWRKKINKDADQFRVLCETLNVVPNIWSLYEWCNWMTPNLTPHSEPPKRPRRFDTMFYVCCLGELPEARVDKRETTVAQWSTAQELLDNKEAEMIGPQLYELSRLENFTDIRELHEFCGAREKHGVQRWMPVINSCSDGVVLVFPGDDLYPHEPDFNGTKGHVVRSKSVQELNDASTKQNRVIGVNAQQLMVTINQSLGHSDPHSCRNSAKQNKAKL